LALMCIAQGTGVEGRWMRVPCHPPSVGAEPPPGISDACREEVYQYKIARNTNINMNLPLGAVA
jgi:hypothetical protein